MTTRRGFITGLVSFVAAPAIVKVESLMKLPAKVRLLTSEEILEEVLVSFRTTIPAIEWRLINQGVSHVMTARNDLLDIKFISEAELYFSSHDFLSAIEPTRDLR